MLSILTCTLGLGCTASGRVGYTAEATTPELVYIDPEVQVIADYDEPIFYVDNYYWRYDRGRWLRSHRHNAGWTVYSSPPRALYTIREPNRYVRYRPDRRSITYRDRIDRRRYRR